MREGTFLSFMTERKVGGAAAKYFPEAAATVYLQLGTEMHLIEGRRWRRKKNIYGMGLPWEMELEPPEPDNFPQN